VQVHIDRNGERFGPYSLEEVNAYLANGTLLPTDLAWQDGMADWLPVSQISGVVMPGGSVATSIPPSQPVPNGNKKKILIGIGAGMGLLALMAGIWFFFIHESREKELLSNDDGSNSTTAKPVKELTKEKPTIKSMLAIVGQSVTKEEENFVGRRKGEYQFGPDEPITHVETIYRKDHTFSIFYLHNKLDDNGNPVQGEYDRQLAHGIWMKKGDRLYFLDLVFDDEKNPEEYQEVLEAILMESGESKFVYKIPQSKDDDGETIPESVYNEESIKQFKHPEMQAYNSANALESFDLLNVYKNAKEPEPFEEGNNE
tara:strand:+ start:127 stop:1068 length:942 start_codon:yes stop_codon:yes gene_type:complete